MQTRLRFAGALCCAMLLFSTGCWMGGRSRSNYGPRSSLPAPEAPNLSAPLAPSQPELPDGPVLDGPAFPQSSEGFEREQHSQKAYEDWRSQHAGTATPPIIPEGPIAHKQTSLTQEIEAPRFGYVELPPAP